LIGINLQAYLKYEEQMNDFTAHPNVGAPILESFQIFGLNGYKNVSLTLEKNVKIITAENGSGKTTLLNALYALLTGKVGRLLAINFSKFAIKFAGQELIEVRKSDIFPPLTKAEFHKIREISGFPDIFRYGVSESELSEMILLSTIGNGQEYHKCTGFRKLLERSPFDRDEIKDLCSQILANLTLTDQFAELNSKIKAAMGDVAVLYLPTYRRIEADLPEYQRELLPRTRIQQDDWDADRLIFFGLQDVEKRLKAITSDIRDSTLKAYSRISVRTLDQLLDPKPPTKETNFSASDLTGITVVLARLGKTDSDAEQRLLGLIKTEAINEQQHEALRSFLRRLLEIYQEKQEYEQAVEAFVKVVDSYWDQPGSEKRFIFDKLPVEARVVNSYTEKPLPLGALSSGEKQIVSIFARLYLDAGKRYLILIDEPELSLSMEWQQKFLPDVLTAPSCAQLIAITHSPFTFDNNLDPYAGSLDISYPSKVAQ
jgi:predicted ATPase